MAARASSAGYFVPLRRRRCRRDVRARWRRSQLAHRAEDQPGRLRTRDRDQMVEGDSQRAGVDVEQLCPDGGVVTRQHRQAAPHHDQVTGRCCASVFLRLTAIRLRTNRSVRRRTRYRAPTTPPSPHSPPSDPDAAGPDRLRDCHCFVTSTTGALGGEQPEPSVRARRSRATADMKRCVRSRPRLHAARASPNG
jgi:hypothetical protein